MKRYIKFSTDVDDAWASYDPFNGKKYRIFGGYSDTKWTNDPYEAIKFWFQIGKKHPGDTCIMCKTKADAIEVVMEGTPEYLTELYSQYKCPYKLEYLIEECDKAFENGCRSFYENEYGDQVHPFSVG